MKKLLRTNLILSAIVAVIAFSSFANAEEEDLIFLSDPVYCNVFYIIEEWGWEIMATGICNEGLCFDAVLGFCNWPELAHPGWECNRY